MEGYQPLQVFKWAEKIHGNSSQANGSQGIHSEANATEANPNNVFSKYIQYDKIELVQLAGCVQVLFDRIMCFQ